MEYVAAKRLADFSELERDFATFRRSVGDWRALSSDRQAAREVDYSASGRNVAAAGRKETVMIPLSYTVGGDVYTLAGLWHLWLKENGDRPPHAVFIGGTVDKAALAVFRRALTPDDFAKLWTQSHEETVL
jgi:type VI secretion system protein VasJ